MKLLNTGIREKENTMVPMDSRRALRSEHKEDTKVKLQGSRESIEIYI